jgi:BASS family bile acid:Na+ symporter
VSTEEIARLFLPITLAIIMFSMGLTLTVPDFLRLVQRPRAVVVGVIMQIVVLPIVTFLLVSIIPMRPEIAVGFMLIAACPGGTSSTMLTHIGRGDLAVSIAISACTSLATIFTLPLIVGWSLTHFMGARAPELPLGSTIATVFAILVGPTVTGMAVAQYSRSFAEWAEPKTRTLAMVVFAVILVSAIVAKRGIFAHYIAVAGPVAFALNFIMMCLAFGAASWFATGPRERTAITLECGVQNSALAIVIAVTMLNSLEISVPAAMYAVIMLFMGFGFALRASAQTKQRSA